MATRSKSVASPVKHVLKRVKLFQQPTLTKELGKHLHVISSTSSNQMYCFIDGVMISSSNAKRLERELKVISQMV